MADATAWDKKSDGQIHQHHRWAQSTTALQVSIALAAIALLTRKKWLEVAMLIAGGAGVIVGWLAAMHIQAEWCCVKPSEPGIGSAGARLLLPCQRCSNMHSARPLTCNGKHWRADLSFDKKAGRCQLARAQCKTGLKAAREAKRLFSGAWTCQKQKKQKQSSYPIPLKTASWRRFPPRTSSA